MDEVGVGPWPGEWPVDGRYDPELLAHGDRRNVVDRYRYWRREAIVADLDARRHPFHVAIENWQHDLNIGTVVRNANAFLPPRCTSSGTAGGTAAARWSPTGTNTSGTIRRSRRSPPGRRRHELPLVGHRQPARRPADGDRHAAPPVCAAVRPGGTGAVRGGPRQRATRSARSPSTARPARSTPGVASGIAMHAWIRTHAGTPTGVIITR